MAPPLDSSSFSLFTSPLRLGLLAISAGSSMKGNTGKAARQRLVQRVMQALVICACFIAAGIIFGGKTTESRRRSKLLNDMPDFMYDLTEEEIQVLIGEAHLVDLKLPEPALSHDHSAKYRGVKGEFCPLDWSLQKTDPSKVPMFRHLVSKSENCAEGKFVLDLYPILQKAREFDSKVEEMRVLRPNGFVFHESRCGSTLVANSLAAVNPEGHRVYSEALPNVRVSLACEKADDKCNKKTAVALLRDVVYMMGRTNDPMETHMFYKHQSVTVRNIRLYREAFPDTPWIFVYREPAEVMASYWAEHPQKGVQNSCVRSRNDPAKALRRLVYNNGWDMRLLSNEEYCAAHLASLCEAAVSEHKHSHTGRMVNYVDIPGALMDSIFPDYFRIPVGSAERQRIEKISQTYSKAANVRGDTEWKGDTEKKEKFESPELVEAAENVLESSYDALERIASSTSRR